MTADPSLRDAIFRIFGSDAGIVSRRPLYGSELNQTALLVLRSGERVFLKYNSPRNAHLFSAEAEGLQAIRTAAAVRAPEPLGFGTDEAEGISFLLMEYVEEGRRRRDYWEALGEGLARLHAAETRPVHGRKYGFRSDNVIGTAPQVNTPSDSWIDFFREKRLLPQYRRAEHYFRPEDRRRFSALLDGLDRILVEPERPSLLHGDLWGGNVMAGPDGSGWLIDPAVYIGHREADLAMTELFGGFGPAFYRSYGEAWPLQPDYDRRRDLYNLYHLLNHLNLFGRGYLMSVLDVVRRYA